LHRSSSAIAPLVLKTGDSKKGRTTPDAFEAPLGCVHHQSSPSIELNASCGPHKEKGHEYQSDDHEFGPIGEDTAGQLLRRTGACGCQCVLRPGRRGEIKRRDRVRMLVTKNRGASYHDEVLRVTPSTLYRTGSGKGTSRKRLEKIQVVLDL
jgi:hypothetical protein